MKTWRHGGRARATAAGTACLLLACCALGPQSADVIFGGKARSETTAPVPAPASGRDGIYTGSAVEANGQVTCSSPLSISNFRVEGNTVRFGGFSGPIAPDGTVMLPFDSAWLTGRFVGQTFNGTIETNVGIGLPRDCTYRIAARRVAG
jgi:hypothetical protein